MQKFYGEGTPHPLPRPHPLSTYGAQAQRDTPEKNHSYGLGLSNAQMENYWIRHWLFHAKVRLRSPLLMPAYCS